jgi:hypothetical protein
MIATFIDAVTSPLARSANRQSCRLERSGGLVVAIVRCRHAQRIACGGV